MLLSDNNAWASKLQKDTEESWMHIAKLKKLIYKCYMLYDSKYMQNYRDSKKIRGHQNLGGRKGRLNGWNPGDF